MNRITSVTNTQFKSWVSLHQSKQRRKQGRYLIEGLHLVEEAVERKAPIQQIIIVEGFSLPEWLTSYDHILTEIPPHLSERLTQTENSQGIFAVMMMEKNITELNGSRFLLIDAVQDPGNVGTMIRTAAAAGYDAVYVGDGSVDIYNDKVIRATQGAIFRIPIMTAPLLDVIRAMKKNAIPVIAAALTPEAVDYRKAEINEKLALVVGNEGSGISSEIIAVSDQQVIIPMHSDVESLNVAVAAGICMFHYIR